MNKKYEFRAEIKKHPSINAGYIEFPHDVRKEFGKGRVKVIASLDGFIYRGSLVRMGENPNHWLGITQEVRKAIGKNPGDSVNVILEEETSERVVAVPDDLLSRISTDKEVQDYFDKLSYTHKKEYVRWITEAKKEETRKNRIEKAFTLLREKIKTPDQPR
ncbi:MAG: YdeI/OmpD-associated family protein [Bacteroidales bacterium]